VKKGLKKGVILVYEIGLSAVLVKMGYFVGLPQSSQFLQHCSSPGAAYAKVQPQAKGLQNFAICSHPLRRECLRQAVKSSVPEVPKRSAAESVLPAGRINILLPVEGG